MNDWHDKTGFKGPSRGLRGAGDAGKRLLSGMGETTRPMMEKVKAAVFSMLLSRCGGLLRLPEDSKWLDLFAGPCPPPPPPSCLYRPNLNELGTLSWLLHL